MGTGIEHSKIVLGSAAELLTPVPSLYPTGSFFPKCFGPQHSREVGREIVGMWEQRWFYIPQCTFFLFLISVLSSIDCDSSLPRI